MRIAIADSLVCWLATRKLSKPL